MKHNVTIRDRRLAREQHKKAARAKLVPLGIEAREESKATASAVSTAQIIRRVIRTYLQGRKGR